jgi:hypothetical protein
MLRQVSIRPILAEEDSRIDEGTTMNPNIKFSLKILFSGFALFFAISPSIAKADALSIDWPIRNSKVICGGIVDGETLNMRISVPGEVMTAESSNGRILIFVDLHKPGQAHWIFTDAMSDDEYDKREAITKKLTPDEAALIRALTKGRQTDLYMGFTDGIVHLRTTFGDRAMSMSCQEIPN